jgi:hypothetical protein
MRRSSTDSGAAVDGPRLTVMKEDNVFRRFLIAAAPVALFSAQAIAADKSPVQFVPMPTYGFDLNVNAGFSHFTNPYNSFSGTDITGEARYWLTISNGGKVQIDISGASMDRDGDIRTHFDVAGHLLFGMGTTTYGIMGSTGTRNSWDRFATIAGEAAWPVMMFGGSQLVVQAGYTAELSDSDTSAYIHGVINTSLTSNVVFSGNLGFASTNDGESYVRYGAQLSMAFNSMLSGNLTWQAAHKTEGSYSRTDNRLTAGLTFRSPGGSTPFHDLNLDTGIISDFKY